MSDKFCIDGIVPRHLADADYECPDAPPLTPKEEANWSDRLEKAKGLAFDKSGNLRDPKALADYEEVQKQFVVRLEYVVVKLAKRYSSQCRGIVTFGDLMQEGKIGLMRALDRHDFRKGSRFSTYATKVIENDIRKALDDNNRTIKLPTGKIEDMFMRHRIQADQDHDEQVRRLSTVTQLPVPTILAHLHPTVSIETGTDNDGSSIADFLTADDMVDSDSGRRRETIEHAMTYISPRCAKIIHAHYIEGLTIQEIASDPSFHDNVARLTIDGPSEIKQQIGQDVVIVGRDKSCDSIIGATFIKRGAKITGTIWDKKIGLKHCRFDLVGEGSDMTYKVSLLGKHKVYLNGVEITSPQTLENGDVLRIGDTTITYEIGVSKQRAKQMINKGEKQLRTIQESEDILQETVQNPDLIEPYEEVVRLRREENKRTIAERQKMKKKAKR